MKLKNPEINFEKPVILKVVYYKSNDKGKTKRPTSKFIQTLNTNHPQSWMIKSGNFNQIEILDSTKAQTFDYIIEVETVESYNFIYTFLAGFIHGASLLVIPITYKSMFEDKFIFKNKSGDILLEKVYPSALRTWQSPILLPLGFFHGLNIMRTRVYNSNMTRFILDLEDVITRINY